VLENNYDYGYLETSTDGGNTWTVTKTYNGASAGWTQESISLPDLDGQTNVRIRFRLASDENVTLDGWHLDDVVVSGGSLDCSTLLSASAEFTSNSPALVGEAMQFFDSTNGTTPISYQWDFGDGLGTSTEANPAYTYATSGEYSVSLTASNAWGSTTVTHQVKASPYGFSLTPAISAHSGIPGSQVAFELSLSNQGGVSDTYDLTIDSTWPVTVMTPGGEWLSGSGLTLDGGETQNLTALITVPPQAETGIPHTTNLDIVSRSEPLQSEHAELITTPDWRAIFLPLVTR
jgi:PKD repeat protein